MTLIVLHDLEIDLAGTLYYVYRIEHERNHKNKKKIIKISQLVYEPDLLL